MKSADSSFLPEPSAEEKQRSSALVRSIRDVIEDSGGYIEFSRFMELALYSPGAGYYASGLRKFGKHGDFVTAPEIGSLFGTCLAGQIADIFHQLECDEVLEVGAGSGALAAQIMETLDRRGIAIRRYGILELSPELEQRQEELLRQRIPEQIDRVHWMRELPVDFDGVIVANEVVDALPVDRFVVRESRVRGLGVAWTQDHFQDHEYETEHPRWEVIQRMGLADGYSSEAAFQAGAWMRSLGRSLSRGAIVLVDYGFPAREYFHPQRNTGTLMCHYRHRSHTDPYRNVGLQDITCHVDFTALANCAAETGLSLLGFTNLASFLLSLGILENAGPRLRMGTRESVQISQEIKTLTLPSEMGELFKVIMVGRGIEPPLRGFAHADHRNRL